MALAPIPLDGAPVLVLCFDPDYDDAVSVRDAGPAIVVSDGRTPRIGGLERATRIGFGELLDPRGHRELLRIAPRDVIVLALHGARSRGVLGAIRHGGRTFHLVDAPGSYFTVNAQGALALAARRKLRRTVAGVPGAASAMRALGVRLDPPFPTVKDSVRAAELAVAGAGAGASPAPTCGVASDHVGAGLAPAPAPASLRVLHIIGALGPGGAERQLTYLAAAQRRAGHAVRVLTLYSQAGDEGHYAPDLRRAGVPCASLPAHPWIPRAPAGLDPELAAACERHVERGALIPLVAELQRERPDVLHAWLDTCNAVSGVAGLAAGVPRIVLATRNVSPVHMPRLDRPYLRETYRVLARSSRVQLLANSRAGAEDYAAWLGIDADRFAVVHNGLDAASFVPPNAETRAAVRSGLGVDSDALLVAGVFRLAPEKAPLVFLDVLARVREQVPALRAVHVGVGPLEEAFARRARELDLDATLLRLGRRSDAARILGVADACLLTSLQEGCPNVSLEAQALEVPPVLTRAGGSPETVDDGATGFLCDVGDVEGLAARLIELANADRRASLGKAGRAWVEERFSLARMVEHTTALYRRD